MTFENLLALGFLPALLTTGRWIQSKLFADKETQPDGLAFWTLSALIGLALWLPVLIATAWLGVFNAAWIGAAGWAVTALALLLRRPIRTAPIDAASWFAIAFSLIVFAWNATYSNESLQGGRDQGVYSNHALVIAKTGSLFSTELFENQFDPQYHHLLRGNQSGGLYFENDNQRIVFQFAPTFATLLAQAHGIAGYHGLFSLNPLLSSLAGLFFFCLLKQFVPGRWAIFGLLCFSLNVVQFWNARITLSEILAQAFIIGGLLLANHAWKTTSRTGLLLGCVLISLNAAVRIDGFLAVIGIGCAILLLRLTNPNTSRQQTNLTLAACASIAAASLVLLFLTYSSPTYFEHHANMIHPLFAVSIATCAIAAIPLPKKFLATTAKFIGNPITFAITASIIGAALLYAYFIRPHLEPFSLLQAGHAAAGTRTFRENSLVDLAAYLNPLLVLLAAAGFLASLRQSLRGASPATLLIGISFIFSLLYLYDPSVSPDHIWRMRRFTPIIIPAFIAFAAIGAHLAFAKIHKIEIARSLARFAFAAILLAHLYKTASPLAFTALNDGYAKFTDTIAAAIPQNAVIITDVEIPLLGPLQLGRDYQVIRGHPNFEPHKEFIPQFAKQLVKNRKDVYFLSSQNQFSHSNLQRGHTFKLTVNDTVFQETPFPIKLRTHEIRAYLAPISEDFLGYSKDDARLLLGGSRILGVKEHGLSGTEFNGETPFRWTEKTASFSIPWIFERDPISAYIQIGGSKPGGTNLKLYANGKLVTERWIPQVGDRFDLPLDKFDWTAQKIDLSLEVDSWIPAEFNPNSTDIRELGVQLYGIEFRFERDDLIGPVEFGAQPVYGITENGLHDTEYVDGKSFRWTNGHASFSWTHKSNFAPTQLALSIQSRPPSGSKLSVKWNDQLLFHTENLQTPDSFAIPIPQELASTPDVLLTIESDSFIPSELNPNTTDDRKLGIMIESIKLSD